jgi:hypothetical protein
MAQTIIYRKTRSHWDDEGDWNPANSGQGKDTHAFTIPMGEKFARYSMDIEVASAGSGCIVEYWPDGGAMGDQFIRVRWWYNPFGKIRYALTVFTGAPETVLIYHGENNWGGKTLDTLRLEQDIDLSGRGPIAKKLFSRIMRMSGKAVSHTSYSQPELATIAVSRDVALGLIASIKYGAVGGILLLALDSGYEVHARFDPHGMLPFDDELTIAMRKK